MGISYETVSQCASTLHEDFTKSSSDGTAVKPTHKLCTSQTLLVGLSGRWISSVECCRLFSYLKHVSLEESNGSG